MTVSEMKGLTRGLPTKAAKIRALAAAGVARADIARFLAIRYQHVRNVLEGAQPQSVLSFRESAPPVADWLPPPKPRPVLLEDGSVVIPAALVGALSASPGEELMAMEDQGGLWIATRMGGVRRAQAIARQFIPEDVSLVDEVFKMRREEVERNKRKWGEP